LKDILEGMEFQSDEVTACLHRPTGRVIAMSDEALHAAEEGAGPDEVEEFELADARGILESGDDYLALPDRSEIDEYGMMERFAAGVADPAGQAELGMLSEVGVRSGASRMPCAGSGWRRSGTPTEIAGMRTWRGPGVKPTAS
jgi:hypothetical protein